MVFAQPLCGNKGSQNYPAERKCHILVKLPSIAHFQNDDAMIDSPPNSCIYRLPNCKSVCPWLSGNKPLDHYTSWFDPQCCCSRPPWSPWCFHDILPILHSLILNLSGYRSTNLMSLRWFRGLMMPWWTIWDVIGWHPSSRLKTWAIPQTMAISRHQPDSTLADSGTGPLVYHVSYIHGFSMEIIHVFSTDFSPFQGIELPGRLQIRASKPEMAAARRLCWRGAPWLPWCGSWEILGSSHESLVGRQVWERSPHGWKSWTSPWNDNHMVG